MVLKLSEQEAQWFAFMVKAVVLAAAIAIITIIIAVVVEEVL